MEEPVVASPDLKKLRLYNPWTPAAEDGGATGPSSPEESCEEPERSSTATGGLLRTIKLDVELIKTYISLIEEDHIWMKSLILDRATG